MGLRSFLKNAKTDTLVSVLKYGKAYSLIHYKTTDMPSMVFHLLAIAHAGRAQKTAPAMRRSFFVRTSEHFLQKSQFVLGIDYLRPACRWCIM